jgi:transketolase
VSTKPTTTDLQWTDLDQRAVDTARVLAADAVQKVGNGHPGTAMSLAPAAYTLFQKVMRHDPADTEWDGRPPPPARWGRPATASCCPPATRP